MSIPFELIFGRTLRRIRQSYDLTQAELASRAGISQAAVSGLESGRKSSSLDTLQNLANSFGISASDLLAMAEGVSSHKEIRKHIEQNALKTLSKTDGWMSLEEAEKKFFAGMR